MKSKNLEILAAEIGQEVEAKNAELEAREIEVPEDYHEEMLAFIQKIEQETAQKQRKQIRNRWLRTAAAFLVCFVGLNAAALGTSEAYREKVFSLFYDEEQGGVTLNFDPGHELIEEWDDYWYPGWLPEGYQLYAAERTDEMDFLLFMSEDTKKELRMTTYPVNASVSIDTEFMVKETIVIGVYDGFYFSSTEQNVYTLIWQTENALFVVTHYGIIEQNILKEIAVNMICMQ